MRVGVGQELSILHTQFFVPRLSPQPGVRGSSELSNNVPGPGICLLPQIGMIHGVYAVITV
jgi:hypothetical protein